MVAKYDVMVTVGSPAETKHVPPANTIAQEFVVRLGRGVHVKYHIYLRLLDSGTLETDLFAHGRLLWQGRIAASLIFGFPVDHSSKSGFSAANAAAGIQLRRSRLLMICTGTLLMLLAVLL